MANLASDDFNRSNNPSAWGTASDGTNTWSRVRGISTFAISSNTGTVSGNSSSYCVERCGSGTSADTEQVITFTRSSTSDVAGLVFRYTDNNNWYNVNIGAYLNNLVFSKMVSGSYSDVAFGGSATYATGTTWKLRVRNIGTSIKARIWDASGSEPGTWNIDTTDTSLSSAGGFGVVADPVGSPVITFDDYTATDGTSVTTNSRTITPVTVALLQTKARTIPATAALLASQTPRVITPTTTALLAVEAHNITPVTATLLQTQQKSIPSTSALLAALSRSIPASSALLQANERVIPTTATLDSLGTSSRTIPATGALLAVLSRSIPASSALLQANEIILPSQAALLAQQQRPIPSTAGLLGVGTRSITPISTTLLQVASRTILTSAALVLARTIPASAAFLKVNTRSVGASVSLASGDAVPSATCVLRSGTATCIIRSGSATGIIR